MSRDQESIELLKKKALELKKGFEEEINRIISEMEGDKASPTDKMRKDKDIGDEDLQEYEKRLEGLKDELKRLKKIKKHQKKINKLEEEREDVIKNIEKRRELEKKIKNYKKH